ncbi:TPA: hypothetical protein ACOEBU_003022, partial [Enterobacter asburiae]
KNPAPKGAGFFALCVRNDAEWLCRPGKRSAIGQVKPHHPLLETFSPSACGLDIQTISGYR